MIGIVILNYENWQETRRCVESIQENPPQDAYQIILVDNASAKMPPYSLQDFIDRYQILWIRNKRNLGYNAGNNVGIAKALAMGCSQILLSNSDVRFFSGSIQEMQDYLNKHRDTGIVGPKILDDKGRVQKSCLCRKTGMKEKYMVRTRAHVIFRKSWRTYFGYDRDYEACFAVHAVLGCCFMMSRACAKAVTPFDEHPFLYEEELILGIQMQKYGFRTVYDPRAVICHLHGASTQFVKPFAFSHNVRSEIYYCRAYAKAKKWQIYPLYMYRVLLYLLRCVKDREFRRQCRWFLKMTKKEFHAVYTGMEYARKTPDKSDTHTIRRVVNGIVSRMGAWDAWRTLRREKADWYREEVYSSTYQSDKNFCDMTTQIKTITFYLPQFHTFQENDTWWGTGFTEWVNTEKCKPRFSGHYQPRRPHKDIGFYDLSIPQAIKEQVDLAVRHQIYGFCFYYYWFSGKTLMQQPLELFLQHPEWKIHFCMCWANENFTRTWDGADQEILMKQEYHRSDPQKLICSLKRFMQDPRYIRVDHKPVLLVYDMGKIPHVKVVVKQWRETARKQGIGEIQIWMCRTHNQTAATLGIRSLIDAEVEIPPHNMWWKPLRDKQHKVEDAKFFSYRKLVIAAIARLRKEKGSSKPLYHTCMLGWDNACRRKKGWTVYTEFSISFFRKWVEAIIEALDRTGGEQIFFVNAWNEWGEGTYLEPDEKYGYTAINTLSECICRNRKVGKEEGTSCSEN
ncbi:MAG: glycoside hydrolase family 99-like domain-containing protein [Eubacterium sp.]|nr:glycoside hydrolase family 99-like domain-containing protein [Eubacterium sp.]